MGTAETVNRREKINIYLFFIILIMIYICLSSPSLSTYLSIILDLFEYLSISLFFYLSISIPNYLSMHLVFFSSFKEFKKHILKMKSTRVFFSQYITERIIMNSRTTQKYRSFDFINRLWRLENIGPNSWKDPPAL